MEVNRSMSYCPTRDMHCLCTIAQSLRVAETLYMLIKASCKLGRHRYATNPVRNVMK